MQSGLTCLVCRLPGYLNWIWISFQTVVLEQPHPLSSTQGNVCFLFRLEASGLSAAPSSVPNGETGLSFSSLSLSLRRAKWKAWDSVIEGERGGCCLTGHPLPAEPTFAPSTSPEGSLGLTGEFSRHTELKKWANGRSGAQMQGHLAV